MEKGSEWYDKSFDDNDHWRQHYTKSRYYALWAVIADRLVRYGAESVLDVGCGPGQFASLLRDRGVTDYLGIDFSEKRIQRARKVCPEFDFSVEDAFETEAFVRCNYDSVVCSEFLEHVEGDLRIIDQIRSGSLFHASVPNFPYEAHVRHFEDPQQVHDRYSPYLDDLKVDTLPANGRGRAFFLIEGIRK